MVDKLIAIAKGQIDELMAAAVATGKAYAAGVLLETADASKAGAAGGASEAGITLGEALRSLVRVQGYCRFAHGDGGASGIPYDTYTAIFDELCRQYFPHDHLDRPLCAASYGPPCESAWGPGYAAHRDALYANGRGRIRRTPTCTAILSTIG